MSRLLPVIAMSRDLIATSLASNSLLDFEIYHLKGRQYHPDPMSWL